MTQDIAAVMRQATALTRAGDLGEATRLIQAGLRGLVDRPVAGAGYPQAPQSGDRQPSWPTPPLLTGPDFQPTAATADRGPAAATAARPARPPVRPLGETLRGLAEMRRFFDAIPGGPAGGGAGPVVAPGAQYLTRSFVAPAGSRPYRLYVPASAAGRPRGLVLMLHGCKQNPDDFAVGTRFNEQAEAAGVLVVYPEQAVGANASRCWNWFQPGDQARDRGEPAILAGLVRAVMEEFDVPDGRIFVAGLSAGGAMAAILGEAYPELFSAVGVHSGLPVGAAHDVVSAFAAMRGSAAVRAGSAGTGAPKRTIVFHGSADGTVHPRNAESIVAANTRRDAAATRRRGRSASGRAYEQVVYRGADGIAGTEHWTIEGAGHAWAGGHRDGSFTDPQGPDASAEMIRFFFEGSART